MLNPIAVNNKGGVLFLRRRRLQFSLMGLIVLIGLLLATAAGVFSIFGSSDQLILEQDYEWVYENEGSPGEEPAPRIRVKANRKVDAWRIISSDDYVQGGRCNGRDGSVFGNRSGAAQNQLNPVDPGQNNSFLRADTNHRWAELDIRPTDTESTKYCFKAVDYPERNNNKYVADDDSDTIRVYFEVGPLQMSPVSNFMFDQTGEGVLVVKVDKSVWKWRAKRSDAWHVDKSTGQRAKCGWQAFGSQGKKSDGTAFRKPSLSHPERTVDGGGNTAVYQWSLQTSDVGKSFCVLLLDYYGRYTYVVTPVVQPLSEAALIVNFRQDGNVIKATANQPVIAWRAVKIRSWKSCDASLFSRPADHEGVLQSRWAAKAYGLEIESPYSYFAHVGGGEYKSGGFSYCFESSYKNKKFYNKSPPVFDHYPKLEISQVGKTHNWFTALYSGGVAKEMHAVEVLQNSACSAAQFDVASTEITRLSLTQRSYETEGAFIIYDNVETWTQPKYYCFRVRAEPAGSWPGYTPYKLEIPESDSGEQPSADNIAPKLIVNFNHVHITLKASIASDSDDSAEEIRAWEYRGPIYVESVCKESLFANRGTTTSKGQTVSLKNAPAAVNGRYYCFRAEDEAGNWGYKAGLVPENTIAVEEQLVQEQDSEPPKIVVDFDHMHPALEAYAADDEEVSGWAHMGPLQESMTSATCETLFASNSGQDGRRVRLTDSATNGKWYCFKAQDKAGNWGYKARQAPDDAVRVVELTQEESERSLSEDVEVDLAEKTIRINSEFYVTASEMRISKMRYFVVAEDSDCSVATMETLDLTDYKEDIGGAAKVENPDGDLVAGWILEFDVQFLQQQAYKGNRICQAGYVEWGTAEDPRGSWQVPFWNKTRSLELMLSHWEDEKEKIGASNSLSRTVKQTDNLKLDITVSEGEKTIVAQSLPTIEEDIKEDSWQYVILGTEDTICNEDPFADALEVGNGREVANPDADKNYCFRVEDTAGQTYYIGHYLETSDFDDLSEDDGIGEGLSDRSWIFIIAGGVAGSLVIISLIVLFVFTKQKGPKFR